MEAVAGERVRPVHADEELVAAVTARAHGDRARRLGVALGREHGARPHLPGRRRHVPCRDREDREAALAARRRRACRRRRSRRRAGAGRPGTRGARAASAARRSARARSPRRRSGRSRSTRSRAGARSARASGPSVRPRAASRSRTSSLATSSSGTATPVAGAGGRAVSASADGSSSRASGTAMTEEAIAPARWPTAMRDGSGSYRGCRRAVAVAQLVEPRVVVPVVAGSSPVRHLLCTSVYPQTRPAP